MLLAGVIQIPSAKVAAQENAPKLNAASNLSLEELSARAGIIFAGRVLSIELPEEGATGGCDCARITFQVDEAIRDATSGDIIIINEWAGLWRSAAAARYRKGEKLLMFYYPPNGAGLTSPVGGDAGRLSVTTQELIQLPKDRKNMMLRSLRLRENSNSGVQNPAMPDDKLPLSRLVRALRLIASEAN
ncbi:MAG: hypothetical protein JWO13_2856 [Acidobacteriales bacterium]|nr:hypothetical protein [Terriglobales bacterium]